MLLFGGDFTPVNLKIFRINTARYIYLQKFQKLLMKAIVLLVLALLVQLPGYSQMTPCDKCDVRYVSFINNNFEKLDEHMVERFLCSLDYSCNMNPSFISLADKTLYAILKKKPELVVSCLTKYQHLNKKLIYELVKNPIGTYNLDEIKTRIGNVKDTSRVKTQLVNCVKMAERKKKQ